MTISLDRPTAAPATTAAKLDEVPGDAHLASAALHLLLATHPEIVDLPFEWRIATDGTVRPMIEVDHPRGREAAEMLAAALELDIKASCFKSREGQLCESLSIKGRWGGAAWLGTVFVPAEGGDRDE